MASSKPHTAVELSRAGDVATVRFTNEGGVNILSSATLGELGEQVQSLAEDRRVRFVVFRGSGKVFLAGADISEMRNFDDTRGEAYSRHGQHVFDAIEALPQVTIAAINGAALGGGCELALACDFRLIALGAKIGLPESTLGLIPGWGGTKRLPRIVGLSRAKRLMYSGERISAEEALRCGLVDETTPTPEDFDTALDRWFAELRPGAPASVARIKRAMLEDDETGQFSLCFSCSEAREGMAAFCEKRPPTWAQ
jgi:enoyl-CoA hydratase